MTEAARTRVFAAGLLAIAVVALAVRVFFVVVVDPEVPALGDASAYHLLAENLADGRGYIRPFDDQLLGVQRPTAEYPPLFPALVAVPAGLGFHSVTAQRLFLALVGSGTVVLIGLLGRRVGGNAVGIVAGALAALYPMLFQAEGTLMAEALYAPLVTAVLLLAYALVDRPTVARAAALGGGLGLLTLTRAEGILLGVMLILMAAWRLRDVELGRRIALGAVALAVTAAVVAPWTIRNAVRLDAFVPVSNNIATLIDGANCDATYRGAQIGFWRGTFSDAARRQPQEDACFEGFDITDPDFNEATVAARHRRDGLRYATDRVGSLPKVMTTRWLRTWGLFAPRQQVDFESLEGRPRAWQMAGTIMYWVLLPLAVAGVVLLVRRRVPVWPLHTTAITVSIVATLTYGQQRFRIAAEPALLVLAAVAIVTIAEGLAQSHRHRVAP